eukprot:SAG22_NODE_151_length_17414_cov_7.812128_3_plen_99_part_00
MPNSSLTPLCQYIATFKDVATQTGPRRYNYSEGLINCELTSKGSGLGAQTLLVTVFRRCHPSCGSIAWEEMQVRYDMHRRYEPAAPRTVRQEHTAVHN